MASKQEIAARAVLIGSTLLGLGANSACSSGTNRPEASSPTPITRPSEITPLPKPTEIIYPTARDSRAQAYCLKNKLARTIAIDDSPDQAREAINTLLYCAYLVQTQGPVK
jgi:hypothetical protein